MASPSSLSLSLLEEPSCHELDLALTLGHPAIEEVQPWTVQTSGSTSRSPSLDSVVPAGMDSVTPAGSPLDLLSTSTDDGLGILSDLKTEDLLPDAAGVAEVLGDEEPFSFLNDLEWQDLEGGVHDTQDSPDEEGSLSPSLPRLLSREEETVKSDLMWSAPSLEGPSSSSLKSASATSSAARWRQQSLTLSECAESLFSDMDLDASPEGIAKILGSQGDARLKQEVDEQEDEEEIDVVSDAASSVSTESAESSVSHRHWQQHFRAKHQQNQQQQRNAVGPSVAAGRSLLRKHHQRGKVAFSEQTSSLASTTMDHSLIDHCYFATTGPSSPASSSSSNSSPSSPFGAFTNGLLTPNESSDDEELTTSAAARQLGGRKRRRSGANVMSVGPDGKRLCREEDQEEKVKFKFRMAFKSNADSRSKNSNRGQRSLLNGNNGSASASKRRSALKNEHCPSPAKRSVAVMESPSSPSFTSSSSFAERLCESNNRTSSGRRSKYAGVTSDQKCREIRDLHNSMERQRRVDLKKHFDILKDQIPELVETDKASKLNILNKASEHCRDLTADGHSMEQELGKERAKNLALKKRLQQLSVSFKCSSGLKSKRSATSSGRVSLLNNRHC